MRPILQFPADLVTFTEEILNGKLNFLCSENSFVQKKERKKLSFDLVLVVTIFIKQIFL